MPVTLIVGTGKGVFVCRSEDRARWQVEGPHFKGWKATASTRTPAGRYLAATASQVYGAALHASSDLAAWQQIENGPAYPEGGDKKLHQIWTLVS
ncbi:MAG: exo-alpha-sialidase, partial [Planctomycetota bacterium]